MLRAFCSHLPSSSGSKKTPKLEPSDSSSEAHVSMASQVLEPDRHVDPILPELRDVFLDDIHAGLRGCRAGLVGCSLRVSSGPNPAKMRTPHTGTHFPLSFRGPRCWQPAEDRPRILRSQSPAQTKCAKVCFRSPPPPPPPLTLSPPSLVSVSGVMKLL